MTRGRRALAALPPSATVAPVRRTKRRLRGVSRLPSLLWTLAFAALLYLGYAYIPVYWDHVEVRTILKEGANLCYHEPSDLRVREFIVEKLRRVAEYEVYEDGKIQRVPAIEPDFESLTIERTKGPDYVRIHLSYERRIRFPFSQSWRVIVFNTGAEQDLSPVKW